MNNIQYIPIEMLHPHPDNPRKNLGDLTELADSIKATGILQNLTVVPWFDADTKERGTEEQGYRVIIGHRRMAAARLAGLTELPCVIADIPYKEQLATMLLENMQRSDLTVYEQAEGFQLMLDLGASFSEIAGKTGFSESTVRRRIKMTELDKTTLKEVSSRQIEIKDFDRLAQIEDITQRNEVLKTIGTANFNYEIEKVIKKQILDKKIPVFKEALRKSAAKKIERRDTWYGGYSEIRGSEMYLTRCEEQLPVIPTADSQVYYCLEEDAGLLRFYTKRPKAEPQKRPQAEIEKEKAIKDAHDRCLAISELSRILRHDFVNGLSVNDKNRDAMLKGAVVAIAFFGVSYVSVSSEEMYKLAEVEHRYNASSAGEAVASILTKPEVFPKVIYEGFGDEGLCYHSRYIKEWPAHEKNIRLDMLYDWLISLGYEMSDEERAMRDGTHEVFVEGQLRSYMNTEDEE